MRRSQRDGIEVLLIFFVLFFEASQLCLCQNLTNDGCNEEERHALLKFSESFDNYSRHVLAWEDKKCCRWKGVKCDDITGHVVGIDLSPKSHMAWEVTKDLPWVFDRSCYVGEQRGSFIVKCLRSSKAMTPSLLELKHLSYLDLSLIDFQYSPIPVFLGSMKQLRYLNLSNCHFQGRVPHQLGNLTNLQILDLNGIWWPNLFMDDCTWISHLSSLQYIDMSGVTIGNEINSIIQVIHNLPVLLQAHFMDCKFHSSKSSHGFVNSSSLPPKVQVLNLGGNSLDAIPEALQNMTSLKSLSLWVNNIDFVPLWLGEFNCLAYLDLAYNRFSGLVPIAIQNMSFLTFLDISGNNLDSVPLWLGEFKFLEHLHLAWNKLTGSFPNGIQNISSLKFLDLGHNKLKDSLESLGQLKNLVYLNLASNLFHGPIPSSFRNMTKLQKLFLEDNQLNGTIPAFFGIFSSLRILDLSSNLLIGVIPDNMGKLQNLELLELSGNHLSGIGPDTLSNLINLSILDLSNNSLEGTLKEIHLDNLSSLQVLRLGMNKLSVELAPNWSPPFQLITLQLPSCKIETPFPQWLQNQKELMELDLSNNGIWGTLPTWFLQKQLSELDLSNNKISGQLPRNLHDMIPTLSSLFLGNNLLNGSIPESLCKLQGLQDLDLSKNKFSSEIPICLGEIDGIALIDLSSNEISGTIPESFCSFDGSHSLQSLSLSNNSLHGVLPSTLRSCNVLEILDLGNNELHGIIPSNIWANSNVLKILRLRQNKFSGTIPLSLCQLSVLQSLDLASNNLIGTIPFCLGNLEGMTLSSNMGSVGFLASGPTNPSIPPPSPSPIQWDKEHVKQVMKGRELDFTKNLRFVVNLDLSNNSLVGFIPEALTSLTKLASLNLSHNYLLGEISSKIGKLKLLESLDLSWNQLAGPLPSSMSSLTSLSYLNLSYNNFSGPIPEGNQFFTLEDSSIYVGNQYLCGEPVLKKCHNNDNNEAPTSIHHEDKNEKEKILFYFVVALGFMTGFWGIIALLALNKSLRYVCFRYMDKIADEIYVAVAIRVARLKREWD